MGLRFHPISCVLLLSLGMSRAAPQTRDDDIHVDPNTGDWWWWNPTPKPFDYENSTPEPSGYENNTPEPSGYENNTPEPPGYKKPTPKPNDYESSTLKPVDFENRTPKPRHHGFIVNDLTTKSYKDIDDVDDDWWRNNYDDILGSKSTPSWMNFLNDKDPDWLDDPIPTIKPIIPDYKKLLPKLDTDSSYADSSDTSTEYEDSGLHGGYIAAIFFGSMLSVIGCAFRVWCWSKRMQRSPTTAVITRTTRIRVLSVAELPKGRNSDTAQLITPPPYEEERSPPAYEAGVNPAPHGEGSEPPPYEQGNTVSREVQRL